MSPAPPYLRTFMCMRHTPRNDGGNCEPQPEGQKAILVNGWSAHREPKSREYPGCAADKEHLSRAEQANDLVMNGCCHMHGCDGRETHICYGWGPP